MDLVGVFEVYLWYVVWWVGGFEGDFWVGLGW